LCHKYNLHIQGLFLKVHPYLKPDGTEDKQQDKLDPMDLISRWEWIKITNVQQYGYCRNEKTQVDALREYYAEHDGGDSRVLQVCIFIGQWGIPFMFITFASIYWTMGMAKYYSG
jgi:hypothetical protein